MTLDKLNKAAALSRWDLDVGDFTEALEEGTKLIFGHIARQPPNKDGGVVRVSELVHRLLLVVETHWRSAAHGWRIPHWPTALLLLLLHAHSTRATRAAFVLRCCC